jgi:hypothetical protein
VTYGVQVIAVEEEDLMAASIRAQHHASAAKSLRERGEGGEGGEGGESMEAEDLIDRELDIFWDCLPDLVALDDSDPGNRKDGRENARGRSCVLRSYVLPPEVASKVEDGSLLHLSAGMHTSAYVSIRQHT